MRLKWILWSLRRALGLSPTQQVFRELRRRSVNPDKLAALEVFGGSGYMHTKDYASQVACLDVWEIDARNEQVLKRAFPRAEVKVTDSYEEMKRARKTYDLIVIDNPESLHGDHYEHFDLFPAVLRLATDSTIIILSVRPGVGPTSKDRWDVFDEAHRARRRAFYRTDHPDKVSLKEMVAVYQDFANASGFRLQWHFSRQRTRSGRVHYLVLKISTVEGGVATSGGCSRSRR